MSWREKVNFLRSDSKWIIWKLICCFLRSFWLQMVWSEYINMHFNLIYVILYWLFKSNFLFIFWFSRDFLKYIFLVFHLWALLSLDRVWYFAPFSNERVHLRQYIITIISKDRKAKTMKRILLFGLKTWDIKLNLFIG